MTRFTEKQLAELLKEHSILPTSIHDANVTDIQPGGLTRAHKYGAVATEADGIRFDSKAEAQEYERLKMLAKCGDIEDLVLQPVFMLQPAFECRGERVREITYRADFAYTREGIRYVVDVKGFRTPQYKLKRKLFLYRYPSLIFVERV